MEQCHSQTLDNNNNHEATNSQVLPIVNSKRHIWVCLRHCHPRQKSTPTLASVLWWKQAADNTMALSIALYIEYIFLSSICFCALLQATIIWVNSINTEEPMDCLLSIFELKTLFRRSIANSCAQFIYWAGICLWIQHNQSIIPNNTWTIIQIIGLLQHCPKFINFVIPFWQEVTGYSENVCSNKLSPKFFTADSIFFCFMLGSCINSFVPQNK